MGDRNHRANRPEKTDANEAHLLYRGLMDHLQGRKNHDIPMQTQCLAFVALALVACTRQGPTPAGGDSTGAAVSNAPSAQPMGVGIRGDAGSGDAGEDAKGTGLPEAAAVPKKPCGELSYGIHYRAADTVEAIARRRAGNVPCAVPCEPTPPFATGPIQRDEHGGYGFLDLKDEVCQAPGMDLPIGGCSATCNGSDKLGKVSVELAHKSDDERQRLCKAFEKHRGPPDVGSCDCLKDDIVWLPSETEAGIVLYFMGTWTYDCGFAPNTYNPRFFPGHR